MVNRKMKRKASISLREACRAWYRANERKAIRIHYEKVPQPLPIGASKIGGAPDVPAGFAWPCTDVSDTLFPCKDMVEKLRVLAHFFHLAPKRGKKVPLLLPMTFMAQFDLTELATCDSAGLLPHAGHLAFFYHNPLAGGDGRGCVFYFPLDVTLQRIEPPEDCVERLPEQKARFTEEASFPSVEQLPAELYDEDFLDEMCNETDGEDTYKLLGWAHEIQGAMEAECQMREMGLDWKDYKKPQHKAAIEAGAADWMLLLQLGTIWENTEDKNMNEKNKKCALMFGDSGAIYYWIRRQDLAACRFDRARLLWQCY